MDKQVNKESLARMSTLQKGYIDQGDHKNSQAIEGIRSDLNTLVPEVYELETSVSQNREQIIAQGRKIDALIANTSFSVIGELSGSDATFKEVKGDTQAMLKYWVPVLIDTSNEGMAIGGMGTAYKCMKLQRSNWLRFEDGTFAPVVGITQEQYDEFMTNDIVRVMEDGTDGEYYPAGTFDAVREWEEWKKHHGYELRQDGSMEQYPLEEVESIYGLWKYYKVNPESGERTFLNHILRPWETPDTKYTIGVANVSTLYLLDGSASEDGRRFRGIFLSPGTYNGQDYSKWRLFPTAIGPGPITTIREGGIIKARNFFNLFSGITNCQSNKGLAIENGYYEADRTYPRVNDIHQVNNMKYARNNNADVTAPYPFAEGGYHALNMFITAIELAAGTKYIHQANLFGSGISSNDSVNAATILQNGGIRVSPSEDSLAEIDPGTDYPYVYLNWDNNSGSGRLAYTESGATTDMSNFWTQYYPKEQCLESQMALSMAVELRVAPLTIPSEVINGTTDPIQYARQIASFTFYGNRYYYMIVPGFEGPLDGSMNARVYKIVGSGSTQRYPKPFKAYLTRKLDDTVVNTPCEFDITAIYRFSLFNGVNLSGDIWAYHGGGLEMVGTPKPGATTGSTGNQIDIYVEPDQAKWYYETAFTKPDGTTFGFENAYEKVLTATNLGDSYTLTRGSYTPWKIAKASSMAQGECYYQWDNIYWISGTNRVRVKSLFRGRSFHARCSPRLLLADGAASDTARHHSGSAQVLVEFE